MAGPFRGHVHLTIQPPEPGQQGIDPPTSVGESSRATTCLFRASRRGGATLFRTGLFSKEQKRRPPGPEGLAGAKEKGAQTLKSTPIPKGAN